MNPDLFTSTLTLTREGLEKSLTQLMPPCAYRDFCSGMLSAEAPLRDRWLELMGIPQMIRLFLYLTKDVAREQDWSRLIECSVPVNIYQMYEVISDNLAIGLAQPSETDSNYDARRQVLLAFNDVMVQRLEGRATPTSQLLEPVQAHAERISSFEQSLSPKKHREFAQRYLERHPEVSSHALEHALWPCLIANIDACVALERLSAGTPIGPMVRRGLISRYAGVNALLREPDMSFDRRMRIGVDTILVVPMTAWYVGILAQLHQEKGFQALIDDGTLAAVLDDSALLLRLLNDLGTAVVTQTDQERKELLKPLRKEAMRDSSQSLSRVLLETCQTNQALSRVYKDVQHGEFNVCLHGLMDSPAVQSLEIFESRLSDAARLYTSHRKRWEANLQSLRARLSHPAISHVIQQFVVFHEKLYAHSFSEQRGEYAV
ncbi:hypothetical protein F0U61_21225 [Archangium violaceum]|uniref:hypothetical protein n=1 Tax=Archangium violaceum TaxID=83451 RepID=UPI002B320A16|nr:hypothetical protein F0U61_21225 [Archangium violaceum]